MILFYLVLKAFGNFETFEYDWLVGIFLLGGDTIIGLLISILHLEILRWERIK